MADNTVKGLNVKFGADTVEFQSGITGINKALKTLNTDLKSLDKRLKLDPKNVELLQKKFDTTTEAIRVTKLRLEEYQKELSQLKDEDIGGEDWNRLHRSISSTEAQLAKFEEEAKQTKKQLDAVNKSGGEAFSKIMEKAEKAAAKIAKVGKSIETAGRSLLPLTAAIGGFFALGIQGSSDLIEATNKVKVAFGENAQYILDYTKTADSALGETQAQVMDTASTLGLLGLSAEEAAVMISRIADVGSLQNRKFEDVSAAFISGINGSTKALQAYGIKAKEIDLQQYLVEQGMFKTRKEASKYIRSLDSTGRQALIYKKIMHDTANAQGDLQNNIDTFAVGSKVLAAEFKTLMTELSERLLPYITKAINYFRELTERFRNASEGQKDFIVQIGLLVAAIGPVMIVIGKLMQFVPKLVSGFKQISIVLKALGAVGAAQLALIALLVVAFIDLYKNNEEFRKKINEVIATIGQFVQGVLSDMAKIFKEDIIPILTRVYQAVLPVLEKGFLFIANIIKDVLMPILNTLWELMRDVIIPIFLDIADFLATYVLPVLAKLAELILTKLIIVFKGLGKVVQGVCDFFGWLWEGAKYLWDAFKETKAVKDIIGLFEWLGEVLDTVMDAMRWIADNIGGIAKGINNFFSGIGDWFSGIGDSIAAAFSSGGTGQFASGGIGTLNLTTSINVSNNGTPIDSNTIQEWGREITDVVSDHLGRRT